MVNSDPLLRRDKIRVLGVYDSKRKHIGLMNALLGDIGEISGDGA